MSWRLLLGGLVARRVTDLFWAGSAELEQNGLEARLRWWLSKYDGA
jgi:hypothetical protein